MAISGNVQPAEQASYIQAGMDGFLGKSSLPLSPSLIALVAFPYTNDNLAKPFKRDEFVRMLNKYKRKPEPLPGSKQPTPMNTPPVVRRTSSATAGSQSAGAPVQPSTTGQLSYPQTAPPAQTTRQNQFKTASPVPFTTAQGEPELSFDRGANGVEGHDLPKSLLATPHPTTNQSAGASALHSPYNVTSPNGSIGTSPLSPDPKTFLPAYPTPTNTPVHNTAYPHTPSQTPTTLPHAMRSDSHTMTDLATPDPRAPPNTPSLNTPSDPGTLPYAPPSTPQTIERSPSQYSQSQKDYQSEYESQEPQTGEHHNVRILVADNSQADRQIYKRMLSQYQADIVSSGTSALDLFDTNNYDVILLDCNLEGILGQ